MNVNQAAFCTVTSLAVGTAVCSVACVSTAATVATLAYGILAVGFGAVSIASMTAFADDRSVDVKSYFNNVKEHSGYVIAGTFQFVAQGMVKALIDGVVGGIERLVRRKIGGEDFTVKFSR